MMRMTVTMEMNILVYLLENNLKGS